MLEAENVVVPLDHVEHIRCLTRRRNPSLRTAFIELSLLLAALIIDLESEQRIVSPDPNVILATDVDRMLEMTNQVLALRLTLGDEEGHQINAKHTAFVGKGAHLCVKRVPRVLDERPTSAMSNR